jgi:hypothetical protein
MLSAAFSAIGITGALVLPRTSDGITDASTTPSTLGAYHPEIGVDNAADRAGT